RRSAVLRRAATGHCSWCGCSVFCVHSPSPSKWAGSVRHLKAADDLVECGDPVPFAFGGQVADDVIHGGRTGECRRSDLDCSGTCDEEFEHILGSGDPPAPDDGDRDGFGCVMDELECPWL